MDHCDDCDIDLSVVPEVQRKLWEGISLCQPCFMMRLARRSGLVPITSGTWVTMEMAIKHYVELKEGKSQC